ncbi:hypothetical protein JTB14_001915 [Gonioctena quinquepunctata]|nr:hypothetical protein JTB14_001915 [Gonioctena quinquepunctata]
MKYITSTSFLFLFNIIRIHGINETCTRNSECETTMAICKNEKCICDEISYYSDSEKQCLAYVTEYKGYCQESIQCDWLGPNSNCSGMQCVCDKKFRWFRGKCQPFVNKGSSCNSQSECYNSYDMLSIQCSAGKICTCNDGYYDRGYDCRKQSSANGDCALDIDCSSNSTLSCVLGRCQEKNNTVAIASRMSIASNLYSEDSSKDFWNEGALHENGNKSCIYDDECRDMANSVCDASTGACRCNNASHFFHNGNCIPGFGACSNNDSDCGSVENSMCFHGSCICKQGFFWSQGKCIAELGMMNPSLSTSSDCVIKPGRLVDSACYCKVYWFNDDSNRICMKTMLQQTYSCLTNEWCDALGPNSFCNTTTNECQCSNYAKLNDNFYCEIVGEPPEGSCTRNSDCSLNEQCWNEKCQCIEHFSKGGQNNVCSPDISGSCDIMGCSHIENSGCAQGVCKCHANFIGKVNRCLKIVDNLDDSCEEDEQCSILQYAVCEANIGGNKTCVCGDGYVDIGNSCMQVKGYGDPCMNTTECTLVLNNSFQCRNSKCQCQTSYVLKDGYCVSGASTYSKATLLVIFFTMSFRVLNSALRGI